MEWRGNVLGYTLEHMKTDETSKNQERPSIQFTEDNLRVLEEIGMVLRKIGKILNTEGYDIVDGKLVEIEPEQEG